MALHTATGEWQSFELRMRHRRAARLALRAEVAAEAGCLDEAITCLDEARALAPSLPEISNAERALAAARNPRPIAAPATSASRAVVPYAAAAAAGLAIAAAGAMTGSRVRPDAALFSRPIVEAAVTVAAAAGRIVTTPPPPALVEPPPDTTPPTPVAVVPDAAAALPVPASVPPLVAGGPALPLAARADLSTPAESEPPSAEPIVDVPPQEPLVRAVLNQYAAAYSKLDADAAQRVWPGVNRDALARAFDGLASQKVSLGTCTVIVEGAAASARCDGTAAWESKVGSEARTDARTWDFELSRAGGSWRIVSARVQNR